jgi:lysophospholipase L1-like esterase
MKRNHILSRVVVTALLVAITAVPAAFAARGRADFTRYVAVGDSLTAGSVSASPINLVVTHQVNSFPAVIARQTGSDDFEQPLISEPGILPELILRSLSPLIIEPKANHNGAPMNLLLPRPYNNLGIPAARVNDLLTLTGAEAHPNPFYQIVLRGQGTAVQQALALNPTFISVWAGANDVLGAVTSGTPNSLTPLDSFTASYRELLRALTAGAPGAGMVTATLPPVTSLPFVTVVPPVMVNPTTREPILINGAPVYYITKVGDEVVQLGPGSAVLLNAQSFLAQGYGIPPALASSFPLPHAGEPLPDAVTLTAGEIAQISARGTAVNAAIKAIAAEFDVPVVDIEAAWARFAVGVNYAGVRLDLSYLTGGIISYDGVHPTDLGYTLVANEFIRTINQAYGTKIPMGSLLRFFDYNAPDEQWATGDDTLVPFVFAPGQYEELLKLIAPAMLLTMQPADVPATTAPVSRRPRPTKPGGSSN